MDLYSSAIGLLAGDYRLFFNRAICYLGGATSQTSLPSHEMQGTFLNCRVSVDLVFARALNNQAHYNDGDFRRLKANVSNTARFVCDTDFYKRKCEA